MMTCNLKQAYLAVLIILFHQDLIVSVVPNETRAGLLEVPCISNVFCWLYCFFFTAENDGVTGTGCCWERERKDEKNNPFFIPEARNVCWCCRGKGLSALSLSPDAVDKYCKILNPNNTDNAGAGVTAATALLTSTQNKLPCNDKLKVQCSVIKVNLNMVLETDKPCNQEEGTPDDTGTEDIIPDTDTDGSSEILPVL